MPRPKGSKNRPKNPNGDVAGLGHNSISGDQLRSIVERIESLEAEKKRVGDDIRDVYVEAKGNGYDCKAIRTIVRLRNQDEAKRSEHKAIVDTYMHALGMLAGTVFEDAARANTDGRSGFSDYPADVGD